MAQTVENFIALAAFYNKMLEVMAAICTNKGGIAVENYIGRFFAADVLQFIVEYSKSLNENGQSTVNKAQLNDMIAKFKDEYEKVKSLTTPTAKPIHEMSLEEFEKVMDI